MNHFLTIASKARWQCWSPRGDKILFGTSSDDAVPRVFVVDLAESAKFAVDLRFPDDNAKKDDVVRIGGVPSDQVDQGKSLAARDTKGRHYQWDAETLESPQENSRLVEPGQVAWSDNGDRVVCFYGARPAIWNISDDKEQRGVKWSRHPSGAAWTDGGKTVIVCCDGGLFWIDTDTGELLRSRDRAPAATRNANWGIIGEPGKEQVAVAAADGGVLRLFDAATGASKPAKIWGYPGAILAAPHRGSASVQSTTPDEDDGERA